MNDDHDTNGSEVLKIRILEANDQDGNDHSCESDHSEIITCSHCGSEAAITTEHCPNCGVNLQLSSDEHESQRTGDATVERKGLTDVLSGMWQKLSVLLSGTAKVTLFLVALGTAIVGVCFPPLWLLTTVLVLLLIAVEK